MSITISKNGRFLLFNSLLVDLRTKERIDIKSPNPIFVCEMMKSNFIFGHQNLLFEEQDLHTTMRKMIYSFLDYEPNSLLEYEIKFGKNLIFESTSDLLTIESIEKSWEFVKEKLIETFPVLTEGLWDWVKEKGSQAWESVKNAAADILKGGLEKFFDGLRDFLMSPVGIGLDVALSTIGVGKVASIIIWGALLIWELYQLSKDINFHTVLNVIFASVGVLVPAFAKTGKTATAGLKNIEQVAATSFGSKSLSILKSGLTTIKNALKQGAEWLAGLFGPSVQTFISGAISGAESFLKKVITFLTPKSYKTGEKLTKNMVGYGAQKFATNAALAKGIEVGMHSEPGQQIVRGAMNVYNDITGKKPVDYLGLKPSDIEFDFSTSL